MMKIAGGFVLTVSLVSAEEQWRQVLSSTCDNCATTAECSGIDITKVPDPYDKDAVSAIYACIVAACAAGSNPDTQAKVDYAVQWDFVDPDGSASTPSGKNAIAVLLDGTGISKNNIIYEGLKWHVPGLTANDQCTDLKFGLVKVDAEPYTFDDSNKGVSGFKATIDGEFIVLGDVAVENGQNKPLGNLNGDYIGVVGGDGCVFTYTGPIQGVTFAASKGNEASTPTLSFAGPADAAGDDDNKTDDGKNDGGQAVSTKPPAKKVAYPLIYGGAAVLAASVLTL